jgi:hypothetical protein
MLGHRAQPVFQQNELLYQRNAPTRIRRRASAPDASIAGLCSAKLKYQPKVILQNSGRAL